jgi:hypothetical protein
MKIESIALDPMNQARAPGSGAVPTKYMHRDQYDIELVGVRVRVIGGKQDETVVVPMIFARSTLPKDKDAAPSLIPVGNLADIRLMAEPKKA